MLELVSMSIEPNSLEQPPLFWTWIGGPAIIGAVLAGISQVIQILVTKKTKTPESIQAQVQTLLDGLQGMINLLTEDKARDNDRIAKLQARIDELESQSEEDLAQKAKAYAEIQGLQTEVARKDLHIQLLATELNSLGVRITGLGDNAVTHGLLFERS